MRPTDDRTIQKFDWGLYPQAENFFAQHINTFLKNNSFAHKLSSRMVQETSTRLFDWIDHVVLPENIVSAKAIEEAGFQEMSHLEAPTGMRVFVHPGSTFFPVLLGQKNLLKSYSSRRG